MKFTEAQLETTLIELLGAEGDPHSLGKTIEPQPQDVLIKGDLRAFHVSQYAGYQITPDPFEVIVYA